MARGGSATFVVTDETAAFLADAQGQLLDVIAGRIGPGHLDPEDGYLPSEALCLFCHLTHHAALAECPTCKEIRS